MQSISWYVHRLKSMSASEVAWRMGSFAQDVIDRIRVEMNLVPAADVVCKPYEGQEFAPAFRVVDLIGDGTQVYQPQWRTALLHAAEEILAHKLSYFDLKSVDLGHPIDWHKDHSSGTTSAALPIQAIDYRDFKRVGDCKLVWEPNRHHHLVVLGRAYHLTRDLRYAQGVIDQLGSWLDANPYGKGMNWRSPLELGVRLINWVWAIDLVLESGLFVGEIKQRVLHAVYLHCHDLAKKYSQGSSSNNHLVGEAAGVFVASCYFSKFAPAAQWRAQSQAILEREILAQSYADGCTREHALGYQFFVIQFYLYTGLCARAVGHDYSPGYWARLEKMHEFVARFAEGGRELPMFGDRDDGYVLDLGNRPEDINGLLSVAAVLFNRADFAALTDGYAETAYWTMGDAGIATYEALARDATRKPLASTAFSESGYYLLQCGAPGNDAVSLFFDCAELGFGSIAAHGHADALSFTLRVAGFDILVDPGTYDYFTYPEWRNYFRSTAAHNTIEIDGRDQSKMLGPFLWGARANARCLLWETNDAASCVMGEHDGYQSGNAPVLHRRALRLNHARREVEVADELLATDKHRMRMHFHVSEHCAVTLMDNNICQLAFPKGKITIAFDPTVRLSAIKGDADTKTGWLSRGYHRKIPITTLVAEAEFSGDAQFRTMIRA
ncbi:MAG: alginate lyase family protein [Pseudomonadota bacterium]